MSNPEALRLAESLFEASTRCDHHYSLDRSAASELQRQHVAIVALTGALRGLLALEAEHHQRGSDDDDICIEVRSAIAALAEHGAEQ